MKIGITSGKSGTCKTSLSAAFASLIDNTVLADCDVDVADLNLIPSPEIKLGKKFYVSKVARKNNDKWLDYGKCLKHNRFKAVNRELRRFSGNW